MIADTPLAEALAKRRWMYKASLYAPVFVEVERLREAPATGMSAVVVSWSPGPETLACLEALKRQGGMECELVFVDNGAGKGACSGVEAFADVVVRLSENCGAYLSRNLGALFASGEVLCFVDDDGLPGPGFVLRHAEVFAEYDVLSVRGVCRPKTDNPLNDIAGHYDLGEAPFPRFSDMEGNSSYLAAPFFRLGGWNDAIRFGHGGVELAYRLWRLSAVAERQIYHPGPVLSHDYIADDAALAAKRERQALAKAYIKAIHPDICDFLSMWKERKGRTDLLRPRALAGERDHGDAAGGWDRPPLRLIEAVRGMGAP